jgi:hypothetical protein
LGGRAIVFNNISVILWWSVLLVEKTGILGEKTHGPGSDTFNNISQKLPGKTPQQVS